ncbi:MAG: trypsin-like peptidase domain-containing protein [Defluviitaleaceae bacterium]|nr:trypsin-like peptidase domain-containing protein [Defluviitaleaceae bacterium]
MNSVEKKEVNFIIVEENKNLYPAYYEHSAKPHIARLVFEELNQKRQHIGYKSPFSLMIIIFLTILGGFSIGLGVSFGGVLFNNRNNTQMNITNAINRITPAVVIINSENDSLVGTSQSTGTGIVFYQNEEYVFIVTNEHVISNAFETYILFTRGREVNAQLVGRSRADDLAVLKINRDELARAGVHNITLASFANSDEVMVGDISIALGNALGQGIITTTMGIVSALDIQLNVENRLLTVMQTDAAINPGNSGGPLINTLGEVVGINTVKLSLENVYGMGYSITSSHALPIIEMIVRGEAQPTIGIQGNGLSMISEVIRERYNISVESGVFISRVLRHTPAYYANIQRGNVITHLNGNSVSSISGLVYFIGQNRIGDKVTLTVYSENISNDLQITLAP